MINPTVSELSRAGSSPLRIRPRPAWRRRLWTFLDSTGLTVFCMAGLLLGMTLIGAGR